MTVTNEISRASVGTISVSGRKGSDPVESLEKAYRNIFLGKDSALSGFAVRESVVPGTDIATVSDTAMFISEPEGLHDTYFRDVVIPALKELHKETKVISIFMRFPTKSGDVVVRNSDDGDFDFTIGFEDNPDAFVKIGKGN